MAGRGELPGLAAACTHVIVAVKDDALESVLPQFESCRVVLHTSGAKGFVPLRTASGVLHPLQSFTSGGTPDFSRIWFGYGGDEEACEWAVSLIEILGAKPMRIASDKWPQYHAAAVFASNYQVTLMDAALELMQAAGVAPADASSALEPLTRAAIENIFREGTTEALTGPIRRGDAGSVARHLAVLPQGRTRDLYVAAAKRTLSITERLGLPMDQLRELLP